MEHKLQGLYGAEVRGWLHDDGELRVDVRESTEDVWVKVHEEQLVSRRWLDAFTRELMVKVAHVLPTFLTTHTHTHANHSFSSHYNMSAFSGIFYASLEKGAFLAFHWNPSQS